jgi:hypothetical protein
MEPHNGSAPMTTKDLIRAELERLGEEDLQALYGLIKRLRAERSERACKPGSFLAKLKDIQIDAPEDFATNLDQYLSGEKRVEDDLH